MAWALTCLPVSPITPAKGGSIIHVASLVPFQGGLTVPSFNGFFIHIVQDAHACGAIGNSNTAPFDEITSPQVVNLVSVLAECIKPREKRVCELNLVRSSRRKLTPAGPGREAYAVYRLEWIGSLIKELSYVRVSQDLMFLQSIALTKWAKPFSCGMLSFWFDPASPMTMSCLSGNTPCSSRATESARSHLK